VDARAERAHGGDRLFFVEVAQRFQDLRENRIRNCTKPLHESSLVESPALLEQYEPSHAAKF